MSSVTRTFVQLICLSLILLALVAPSTQRPHSNLSTENRSGESHQDAITGDADSIQMEENVVWMQTESCSAHLRCLCCFGESASASEIELYCSSHPGDCCLCGIL
ncbi:hypothetical protein Mapa_010762 [Marchantia paleacea]|nr:hypothetical protein Mapa_010762 [Marchantia paleacea]